MSNSRTTETKVIWHLELTAGEDACLQHIVQYMAERSDFEPVRRLCKKLSTLFNQEGTDEIATDPFDDSSLPDPVDLTSPGAGKPDLHMGGGQSGDNPCCGSAIPEHPAVERIGYKSPFIQANDAANKESDLADMSADLSASSVDANLRLAKLADICSGRGKDAVAEDRHELPQRRNVTIRPDWDR